MNSLPPNNAGGEGGEGGDGQKTTVLVSAYGTI